jgi:hypothetical protein
MLLSSEALSKLQIIILLFQELGFDYTSSSPSEIDHDVLFREGETREVIYLVQN